MRAGRVATQSFCATFALLLVGSTGCGRYVLSADDVIVAPDRKATLAVSLFRDFGASFHANVNAAEVRFLVDRREVGRAVTDRDGRAAVRTTLAGRADSYEVQARVGNHSLRASAPIYHWTRDKTVIAVDIDETISATKYSDLFVAEIDGSKPIHGSANALWALSKKYQILYFSARPVFLQDKTRRWLKDNYFPPAPSAFAMSFEACLRQAHYKRLMLEDLRSRWPNLLVGIGDKKVDDEAYGPYGMLTLIVNRAPIGSYTQRCIMCRDWQEITTFFNTHEPRLTDPTLLAGMLERHGEQLRPAFANAPRPNTSPELVAGKATAPGTQQLVKRPARQEPSF